MARRRSKMDAAPAVEQLFLFRDSASLVRINAALNEHRFYRMEIWPDLFGRALLMRQWGRIGTEGHRRLDPYPDMGAALNALAALVRHRRRRGYVDRPPLGGRSLCSAG